MNFQEMIAAQSAQEVKSAAVIAAELVNEGNAVVTRTKVKRISVSDDQLIFELARPIPKYRDGQLSETTKIYVYRDTVASVIAEDENIAMMSATIGYGSPTIVCVLLAGADIELCLREVKGGKPTINPFSPKKEEYTHAVDSIETHLIKVSVTDKAINTFLNLLTL